MKKFVAISRTEECNELIIKDKEYPIINFVSDNTKRRIGRSFNIIVGVDQHMFCLERNCSHIYDGSDWEIKEID